MIRLILTILAVLLCVGQAWAQTTSTLTSVSGKTAEYAAKLSDADVTVKLADKPVIDAAKWDREAWIELTYHPLDLRESFVSKDKGVLATKAGGVTWKSWTLGEGVLECSLTFDKLADVPKVIELDIRDSGNLEYLYQDTLENDWARGGKSQTLEQYLATNHRPDNVVGSYAVYVRGKRDNQYKTGKFGHIYRWWVIGANGATRWCEPLSMGGNKLTIALPDCTGMQFPVVAMGAGDTLGWTGHGSSSSGNSGGYIFASGVANPTANGTATSMSVYINLTSARTVTMGIYDTVGGVPKNKLRDTGSVTGTNSYAWLSSNLDSSLEITTTGNYWIAFNVSGIHDIGYDTVAGQFVKYAASTYTEGTLEDPCPATSSVSNLVYSIYATYTTGGGVTPSKSRTKVMILTDAWQWLKDLLAPQVWAWGEE